MLSKSCRLPVELPLAISDAKVAFPEPEALIMLPMSQAPVMVGPRALSSLLAAAETLGIGVAPGVVPSVVMKPSELVPLQKIRLLEELLQMSPAAREDGAELTLPIFNGAVVPVVVVSTRLGN